MDRVGGCYSTLFVVMWSDRRVATSTEEPEVGRVVFSREAHEWGGADVLRWKPIQLWRKGLRTTDDGKNGHGPSDTYIKSNQTTLGDRPRGRSFQLELGPRTWHYSCAAMVWGHRRRNRGRRNEHSPRSQEIAYLCTWFSHDFPWRITYFPDYPNGPICKILFDNFVFKKKSPLLQRIWE